MAGTVELERLKIDRSGSSGGARRRGRNPWPLRIVLVLALVGAGWLFRRPILDWYERTTLQTIEVVRATEISATQSTALSGTSANGYLVAATRAALSADTPGRVVALNVTEGSVVKEGDVVARLFSEELEAAVARAAADVELAAKGVERAEADARAAEREVARFESDEGAARARLESASVEFDLAGRELARLEALLEEGFGTERDVDVADSESRRAGAAVLTNRALVAAAESATEAARSRLAAAEAAVVEANARVPVAEAALAQARATLSKTEVRAPFDGVVVLKDAEVGEVVSPNSQGGNSRGSVVTMVDFASLEVQIDLPETSLSKVAVGQNAAVFVDAFEGERFDGTVDRIWPTASRQKATVEVRVAFDAVDERLKPDMGARVVFGVEDEDASASDAPEAGAILLPASAFLGDGEERRVFVFDGAQVNEREVVTAPGPTGRLRVVSGLEDGERVAKDAARLEDGQRVREAGE